MKLKRYALWLLIFGIVLLLAGIVAPIAAAKIYTSQHGSIGIIGGADGPTARFLAWKLLNGWPVAFILLGLILIVSASVCLACFSRGDIMKAVECLPEGYREICAIDLQKDKKMAVFVNLLAIVIAVLLAVPMHFVVPIFSIFSMESGIQNYMLRFGALLVLMLLYMVLHELVHGIAMKLCGTKKVKYGFTGMYAFAGSKDFYGKGAYIFIALAPVVLLGIVLAMINLFVPVEWFWVVYLIQITNLSGAAGDLFVTVKFSRLPRDILVQDYGVGMKVYSQE